MKSLPIGELSRRTTVNIETIRFYEKKGILPAPKRHANGRRVYDEADVRHLNFSHRCRGLGFSLKEVASLLSLADAGDGACKQVHELTVRHAMEVKEKIRRLRKMETVLLDMADQCERGRVPNCPIIECLFDK